MKNHETPQAVEAVPVTQADRDAAASLIEAYWSGVDDNMMQLARSYRAGYSQGAFVRAFRDHRLSATTTPPPASNEHAELIEKLLQCTSHNIGCAIYQRSWVSGEPPCTCGLDEARQAADALQALSVASPRSWIAWAGGDQPVPGETVVEFEQRDGKVYQAAAKDCCWVHDGPMVQDGDSDIVRYRTTLDQG